jgi:twitching motility protein PilT
MSIDTIIYRDNNNTAYSTRSLLEIFKQEKKSTRETTDLHLKADSSPAYRINGLIRKIEGPPISTESIITLIKCLIGEDMFNSLKTKSSIDHALEFENMLFRINCFYESNGPAIAIRALESNPLKVEEVGFPNGVWKDIINLKNGLVLLTGATGSGKTTTIASLVNRILEERACRIITLEDPVEYRLKNHKGMISHREIGTHVESFSQGLRDCMREDPDVIVIGEMRDAESAALALTAAETGHLVFSTLHTRDTQGAITRITDMLTQTAQKTFAYNQLSLTLRYVISQKLIPKSNGSGRILAMEILNNTYAVSNIIRKQNIEQLQSIIQTHMKDISEERMITLDQSLQRLLNSGAITKETAREWAHRPCDIE